MLIKLTKADFTTENYIEYLNQIIAVAEDNSTIILPKDCYHFYEQHTTQVEYYLSNTTVIKTRNIALLIKNKQGLTIDFNGSLLMCHGYLQPLTIDISQNITVKNFTIDWEIPLSAEGEAVSIGDGYTDFKIDSKKFPHCVKNGELYFSGENWEYPLWRWGHTYFDAETGLVPVGSGDAFDPTGAQMLSSGNVRIFAKHNVPVGCITVLRHGIRSHAAIFTVASKNICYDNITVHATAGLGLLCQFNENLTFNNIHFEPSRSCGIRFVCGHDDGIHLVNNKGDVSVKNSSFYGLMDDAINIHGIAVRVMKIIDDTSVQCKFMHEQSIGFNNWAKPGDIIGFIENESMASYYQATVQSLTLETPTDFILKFEEKLPTDLKIKNALENITNNANFVCKNNYFGPGRARGVLISTGGNVLVENNTFETAGCAILIAGDSNQWFESGACHNVIIKSNIFKSACLCAMYQFCEGIISICPEIPNPDVNKPFHSNITIENNEFNPFDYPVLYAFCTDNLQFSKNTIKRSTDFLKWHERHHMINLNKCKNIIIAENQLVGDVLGRDIFYEETGKTVLID